MTKYLGCKVVEAEPCKAWKDMGNYKTGDDGYKITYSDGYVSWSPKDVFKEAYVEISNDIDQKDCLKLAEALCKEAQ